MVSVPIITNEGTPLSREPFVFPSYGNIGPPYIIILRLPSLTIGSPVWLFSTLVISNVGGLGVSTPPTHQPHVDFCPSLPVRSPSISPSSPSEISQVSIQIDKKKKKQKEKKKKNQKGTKPPTTSNVESKQPTTVNSIGSVDEVNKIKTKNLKPKFPCSLCKGNHFLRDCPGIPKVLEMCSSTSSSSVGHVGDAPSNSDVKVGKNKITVKFHCMLCKFDHYSHLCLCMDKASSLLEKIQLPKGYHKLSPNPSLVDGLVNLVLSPVNLVDQVVNLVSSLVETLTKVVDIVPSSIIPTFHLESETQVIDLVPSLISPTLHPKSVKVVDLTPSSIDPTPPLRSVKVVAPVTSSVNPPHPLMSTKVIDLVPSSVSPTLHPKSAKVVSLVISSINPTLPLKISKVVDLISSSIDLTLPLESKPDYAHVFLVDIRSTFLGGISPSPVKTTLSNEAIPFDWGGLTKPSLPSHIHFKIPVQVCVWDVPHRLIDEGLSVIFLSSIAWKYLSYPKLVLITQTLFSFNRRTSHPLGITPQFPVTLEGKKNIY
jgi:hypothetical protein